MRRGKKNKLTATLALALVLGIYGGAEGAGLGKVSDLKAQNGATSGNTIYYGAYKQDSDGNGGYKKGTDGRYQGVAYKVLDNTNTSKVVVLSDKIMDAGAFRANEQAADANKWSASDVYKQLNDTTNGAKSYINDAFSNKELGLVNDSTVDTNKYNSTTLNETTTQKVYLLSVEEITKYFGVAAADFHIGSPELQAQITDYAAAQGGYESVAGDGSWWLRSPGSDTYRAVNVFDGGNVYFPGTGTEDTLHGARPALQLNLDSVLFTSVAAAGSGKSAATAGGGFIIPSDITSGSTLKLTMKDEYDATTNQTGQQEINVTKVTNTANLGMTYKIASAYTGDKKNNQVIAGLIGDTSFDNWTSYAKMAEFANGATEASGTASIAQAGPSGAALADGIYGLSLYSEQANDYDRTDWAGKFKNIFNIRVKNNAIEDLLLVSTLATEPLTVDSSTGVVTLEEAAYDQDLTATNGGTYKIGDGKDVTLNSKLTLTNGNIDMTDANGKGSFNKVTINEFNGNGNFIINTDLANNTGDTIAIGTANNATANLQIAYDPYFDTTTKSATLPGSYKVLTVGSGQMSAVNALTTDWGAIRFTPTIIDNGDNTYNIGSLIAEQKFDPSENTMTAADARATLDALWRENSNNLSKRMGDLRLDQAGDDGIWARFQRSNNKLKGNRDANLHSNLFQAGYDKQFSRKDGKSYVGIAVDHSDGTGSYDSGSGDVKSTNVALYTTWIGNSGHYYDIILKQGHYSNEYDVTDLSGTRSHADFGMNATTLSGEYGYRKHLKNGAYIEPQAELIYGHLSGDDYTTDLGWPVHVDGYNHFIARLGIAAGRETKQGSYYAKASYYHDFSGGGSIRFDTYSYERDAVKNWAELTLGGDVKLGKNWRAYGEVNKYFGDVRNSLNYDIGVRCSF